MDNSVKANMAALKQHYFTPSEAKIPNNNNKSTLPTHHATSLILNYKLLRDTQNKRNIDDIKEMDGFLILESSGSGFPEDVRQICLADRQLRITVEDDFSYFTEVIYIDASENFLMLEPFGAFPKLVELKLACNNINKVENIVGFGSLLYLDLSYNKLSIHDIPFLESIPNLKELDLSGNNLGGLPVDLKGFIAMEKIILDYNKIDSSSVFFSLASIPNLRQASLANNFLSSVPAEACLDGNLKFLEILNLAFNYFSSEDKIECLVTLPRLVTLMLFGNPVLGPSGEDPMFVYIEDLVEKACECRNGSNIKDIDFVTEVPRRRVVKKGQQLGRLAAYRDFSIKQIDTTISSRSTREWRKIGSDTLFAEAVAAVAGNSASLKKTMLEATTTTTTKEAKEAVIPDFTFITSSVGTTSNNPYSNNEHINQTDKIADDIMQQVAVEMGLINSAELLYLRDRAKLPTTATRYEELFNDHLPSAHAAVRDTIPSEVTHRGNITDSGALAKTAQPVALKTAMKTLSHLLKQPLTDYNDVYDSKQYGRATVSSKNYQKPRRLDLGKKGFTDVSEEDFDKKINRYLKPGLPEPIASKDIRSTRRQDNLNRIENVLDNLNENTVTYANSNPTYNLSAKDTLDFIKPKSFKNPAGIKELMEKLEEDHK